MDPSASTHTMSKSDLIHEEKATSLQSKESMYDYYSEWIRIPLSTPGVWINLWQSNDWKIHQLYIAEHMYIWNCTGLLVKSCLSMKVSGSHTSESFCRPCLVSNGVLLSPPRNKESENTCTSGLNGLPIGGSTFFLCLCQHKCVVCVHHGSMWKCEVYVLFLHSLDPKRLSSWTVKFVQIQAVAPIEINTSRILSANFAMVKLL